MQLEELRAAEAAVAAITQQIAASERAPVQTVHIREERAQLQTKLAAAEAELDAKRERAQVAGAVTASHVDSTVTVHQGGGGGGGGSGGGDARRAIGFIRKGHKPGGPSGDGAKPKYIHEVAQLADTREAGGFRAKPAGGAVPLTKKLAKKAPRRPKSGPPLDPRRE